MRGFYTDIDHLERSSDLQTSFIVIYFLTLHQICDVCLDVFAFPNIAPPCAKFPLKPIK